ncbi:MAG: heme exporter protein CcmD [Usitatibacteraceae bacterium]
MNWAEFFSMGGRGFYVWGSYGAFALAIILEIALLRARAKRVRAEISDDLLAEKVKGGVR